jgi:hypothetical protein
MLNKKHMDHHTPQISGWFVFIKKFCNMLLGYLRLL